MSRGSAPLYLEPRPSRWLAGLVVVIHSGATVCALLIPVPWWARLSLAALFLLNLVMLFPRYVLLRRHAVTALLWDELGEWRLWIDGGKEVAVRLEPDNFTSPRCVVLNFRTPEGGARHAVVLFPDSLDAGNLRRLRVRLRTDGPGVSG